MIERTEERRVDTTQAEIRSLLMSVTDPKDKAMVLLFQQVSANQEHLAEMIRNVAEKQTEQGTKLDAQVVALVSHSTNELVISTKFKTAYRIISVISATVIGIAAVWYGDYRALGGTVAAHTITISEYGLALKSQRKDIDLLQEVGRIQDGVQRGRRDEPRP